MAIDYRKEVDSGFDRKRIVEANVIAMLKEGVPIEIIKESTIFNPRHFEMVNNLQRGYSKKEEDLLQIYGGYSKDVQEQIVPDRYSGVSHPIGGELYPMTAEEEKEKFSLRDSYVSEIEKLKNIELERLSKEKERVEQELNSFRAQSPVIENIIALCTELDSISTNNNDFTLDALEYTVLFRKYGLTPQKLTEYNKIYQHYQSLCASLKDITEKYELAVAGKGYSLDLQEKIFIKNELEAEIIQRNTKLVNSFIRQKYGRLLVETDELFQVCYIAMWKAAKAFDYKVGVRFSSLAYKYMDNEVKHNFKALTGYSWETYWKKRKFDVMIKITSELLGYRVNIFKLFELGLISYNEFAYLGHLGIVDEHNLSDVLPSDAKSYDEYEFDSSYELYHGDDEVEDYSAEEFATTGDEWSTPKGELEVLKAPQKEQLIKILFDTLNQNEALVLVFRYGLIDENSRSYEEIGRILNLDKEKIKMIELKSLRKLSHPDRMSKLKVIFDLDEVYDRPHKAI